MYNFDSIVSTATDINGNTSEFYFKGIPDISTSVDTLNFGEVFIDSSITDTLIVSNSGTDLLIITNIFSKLKTLKVFTLV